MAGTGQEDYEKFSVQVTVIGKEERKTERKEGRKKEMNKEGKKEIMNIGRNNTNREVNVFL